MWGDGRWGGAWQRGVWVGASCGVGAWGGRPEIAGGGIWVAEASPRLLVTAPGWAITRADEFEPDSGELTFSDGSHRFELHWYPAQQYRRDRKSTRLNSSHT